MSEEKQETDQISPAACLLLMAKDGQTEQKDKAGCWKVLGDIHNLEFHVICCQQSQQTRTPGSSRCAAFLELHKH